MASSSLAALTADTEQWIGASTQRFRAQYRDANGRTWMVKFFPPQYLDNFLTAQKPVISTSPGFTWGDGVYMVPPDSVFSAMIYGRVGIMGWMSDDDLTRVYDACDPHGLALYQAWIQFRPRLFDLLTTTVHAQHANQKLRNAFRKSLAIDLVMFRPDEFNRLYVRPKQDCWFVVSDFGTLALPIPRGAPYSSRVRDCELVAVGTEEFIVRSNGFVRQDVIGPGVDPAPVRVITGARTAAIVAALHQAYARNRARGNTTPHFVHLPP